MYEKIKNQIKELSKEVMEKVFGGLKAGDVNSDGNITKPSPKWVPGTDPETWNY
jgi:hypothetical protein